VKLLSTSTKASSKSEDEHILKEASLLTYTEMDLKMF